MPCCCMTAPDALAVSFPLMALPFDWPFHALSLAPSPPVNGLTRPFPSL